MFNSVRGYPTTIVANLLENQFLENIISGNTGSAHGIPPLEGCQLSYDL